IPIHVLDCTVLLVLVVQLGISYREEDAMQRLFNFATNGSLACCSLVGGTFYSVSLLVGYPLTLQNIREAVPRGAWRHPLVNSTAVVTTAVLTAVMTVNTLLYLVPVALDVWRDNSAPTTILFKVLTPCLSTSAALLAVRLWPSFSITPHLQASQGFDALPGGARMVKHGAADPLAV
ncbi:hypothetical protein QJQ45_019334, partial [Haematococcus lacustris]